MKKWKVFLLIFLLAGFWTSSASATYMGDISYYYTDNGGGNYTFTFKVHNTSTGTDTGALDFFSIALDADTDWSLYQNVAWVSDNSWSAQAFQYDPSFGTLAAEVNADDAGGGIAQGGSLGGFSIKFSYSGVLAPTAQLFSWYAEFGTDPDTYEILGSANGSTRYEPQGPGPVPEPSTFLLLATGLAGALGLRRKHLLRD